MDAIKEAMIAAEDSGESRAVMAEEIERLNAEIEDKNERMLTLEWRLGEMVALMQGDIDYKKITPGDTRLNIMDECRDLLGLKGR